MRGFDFVWVNMWLLCELKLDAHVYGYERVFDVFNENVKLLGAEARLTLFWTWELLMLFGSTCGYRVS